MRDECTDGTGCDDGLKNPLRFSVTNRTIDMKTYLRHPGYHDKRVTEIVMQNGQIYIHWECAVDAGTKQESDSE